MFFRENKKVSFYYVNRLFILLLGGLILAGSYSALFLYLAFIVLALKIIFSNVSNSICWSIFLISNLKMFNGINISFLVNILMVLPLLMLVIKNFNSKSIGRAISFAFCLFFVEMVHILWNDSINQLPSLFSWAFGFCILFEVLTESNWFAIYSFIAEVFFSYRIYIVPLHQNSRLRYANFIFPHFWYIIRLLFPFKYPINPATLILGGILGQGISRLLLLLRLSIGITFAKFHVFLFVSLHKILSACTSVRTRCDTYNSISYVLYCLWYYFALAL